MAHFKELLNGIYYLKDYVPLNMFMLNCQRVNIVLANMVNELCDLVTNYFVTLNQNENRR